MYMLVLFLFFRNIKYACKNFKLFYQKKKKIQNWYIKDGKGKKTLKKKEVTKFIILYNYYLINIFLSVPDLIII